MIRKKKITHLLVFLILTFVYLTLFNSCVTHKKEPEPEEKTLTLKEKIDIIVNPRIDVGGVVGIIFKGKRHDFFYGEKTINGSNPPDANTIFEIGSITKTFTTTILAHMSVNQIIDVDDVVGNYLPADKVTMPSDNGTEITFTHLATHTSGLPREPDNFIEFMDDPDDPFASYTSAHMYTFLNDCYLSNMGTHLYSNLGVGLLGHTLGLINGISYEELLFQTVFNVLGMTNSSLFLTDQQKNNLAVPHDKNLNITSNWNANDCFQGAGFIKTSLNDMFKYLKSNMGLTETPLKNAMELAQEIQMNLGGDGDYNICLAWFNYTLSDGQEIILHSGGTGGYYTFIGFNKSLSNGVIFLCNQMGNSQIGLIGIEILKILKTHEE